jgi:hypothetical protein
MPHSIEDVRAIAQSELKPLTVTVATARKISGLGNTTIWALIKARKLETVRVGHPNQKLLCWTLGINARDVWVHP